MLFQAIVVVVIGRVVVVVHVAAICSIAACAPSSDSHSAVPPATIAAALRHWRISPHMLTHRPSSFARILLLNYRLLPLLITLRTRCRLLPSCCHAEPFRVLHNLVRL